MSNLMLHSGGWLASLEEIKGVPVPDATATHHPVPYARFIEEVRFNLQRFSLHVVAERFALAREGQQVFGIMEVENGEAAPDWRLCIGLRSSYDKSLAQSLAAGSKVFVCDNLAMSGEVIVSRKHTANIFRDMPGMVYEMLERTISYRVELEKEIAAYKLTEVSEVLAHHVMVEAVLRDVMPASDLPRLLKEWSEPTFADFQPRTAWSLFNAFTHVAKKRSPATQMDSTLRLSKLFREVAQVQ